MDKQQVLSQFIDRIEDLHEVEYGDFKRKMGLYINRLEKQLKDPGLSNDFYEIRNQLIYNNPTTDIEEARHLVIKRICKIMDLLDTPRADRR